jgi:uncharacterized membrane protein
MSEALPAPGPPNRPLSDERQMAFVVYIVYLVAVAFAPLAIAGLVLAYVNRETAPDWLKSHSEFQIRTFWITLLYLAVSIVLFLLVIGPLLFVAAIVLYIVRCALGLNRLMVREAYPNPRSWIT